MPVTAKLSQRFYEKVGDDVANELVEWFNAVDLAYRTELRDLNEINFARFDAKLEQRVAELRADLRQEMAELRQDLTALHRKTEALEQEMDQRFDTLRHEMDQRFDTLRHEMDQRFGTLRHEMDQGFDTLRREMDQRFDALRHWTGQKLQAMGQRMDAMHAGLRSEMQVELHSMRSSLLRWMFGFWVTTLLALAGLTATLLSVGLGR